MAKLTSIPTLQMQVQLTLSYEEMLALSELSSYRFVDLMEGIEKTTGNSVCKKIKPGLESLLDSVSKDLPSIQRRFTHAEKVLSGEKNIQL